MKLIATCPEETKPALAAELCELGAEQLRLAFRAIEFDASAALYYELHLRLRSASRLPRLVKEVPAHTPPMLRSQVRRIHWPEWFDPRHGFMVEAVGLETAGAMTPRQVITEVREMRSACPGCAAVVAMDFVACPACGRRLGGACPGCGRGLQSSWTFCPYCAKSTEARSERRLRERYAAPRELPASNVTEFKKGGKP